MKKIIPLFLLLFALAPVPVFAQGRGRLIEALNLSSQQQRQLEAIRQERQSEMESLSQQSRRLRQEMEQLLSSNASEAEIRAKFAEMQSLKNTMGRIRFEQMLAMREVLTPEQRVRFMELMNQRRGNP